MTGSAIDVIEAFGAAGAARDLDATIVLVTDDCVFDATGRLPTAPGAPLRAEMQQAQAGS